MHLAAMNGNIDAVRELLNLNSEMVHVKDNEGRNPLHFAAESGQYLVIKQLSSKDRLDINEKSGTGKTALMYAAERGHVDFIISALKAGADQKIQDASGMNAMMMAAKIGHLDIVSYLVNAPGGIELLTAAAPGTRDVHGRTPFLYAAASGQSALVDWMIKKHGKDIALLDQVDNNNVNAMHLAAKYGQGQVCSTLVHLGKAAYLSGQVDDYGQTPLHYAVKLPENGFTEILDFHTPLPLGKYTCVDIILKESNDLNESSHMVNLKDNFGQTAISRAVEYGCSKTINRLFRAGADPKTTVQTKNRKMKNMNMIHYAIYKNQIEVIDTLIKHGVDRAARMGPDNATPLLLAIKQGNYLATVKMLHYNNRSDKNVLEYTDKKNQPRTALIWATIQGNGDILKAVIGNGANVNFEADNQKLTALHFAAAKGDNEIATILLNAGAKYDVLDQNGISPLDTALYYNNPSVLKNLIYRYEKDFTDTIDADKLTVMFEKAIKFTQNNVIDLSSAAALRKRDEVLNILNEAAKNHFEAIAGDMDLSVYADNMYENYYEYFYPEEFFETADYEDYGALDVASRKKRSPRHLKKLD